VASNGCRGRPPLRLFGRRHQGIGEGLCSLSPAKFVGVGLLRFSLWGDIHLEYFSCAELRPSAVKEGPPGGYPIFRITTGRRKGVTSA